MKFGRIPTADAAGAILAHSIREAAVVLKKGRVLDGGDVRKLMEAGIAAVVVARLEADELGEDDTARYVTEALLGGNLRASAPFTGRSNVYAGAAGLLVYEPERLDRLNLVDEAITIAALPAHNAVEERQLVATVKIIPYGVAARVVNTVVEAARSGEPLLRIAPFMPFRAGLVQTGSNERLHEKSRRVMDQRLSRLGSVVAAERRCAHHEDAVAEALRALAQEGCGLLLIAGASATADRRDVVPAGIGIAGGRVLHMGMPVEPGNLLLLGEMPGGRPVICLPGCARSPALNGADWVLERLLAGLAVSREDIMRMGAGGLIKQQVTRGAASRHDDDSAPRQAIIGAVVLAADAPGHDDGHNSLLDPLGGEPIIRRVVRTLQASQADPVVVVLGCDARVRAALEGCEVIFAENPEYASGLSSSLRRGLDALPGNVDGALLCLGNMPWIGTGDVDRLIAAFEPGEGRLICIATHRGRQGHPVLWARRFFDELRQIRGTEGAKDVLGRHAEFVCEVESPDDGVVHMYTRSETPEERTPGTASLQSRIGG